MHPINAGLLAAALNAARLQVRRARGIAVAVAVVLNVAGDITLAFQPALAAVAIFAGLAVAIAGWSIARSALQAIDRIGGAQ